MMRVTMLLLCLSSLLCCSVALADRGEQISLTDAVKMIRELQEANVDIRSENAEIRSENAEIRVENAAIRKENAEIQRENTDVYKVNEAMKSEISELKEANAEIRVENAAIQRENAAIRKENAEVHKVNEAMKSEISELKEANAEIRVENAVIQRENAAIQNENAAIGRKNAEVQKENVAMKSKTFELSNIVSHVQMDIVDLQINVSTSSQQISVLNDRDSGHVGFSVAANQIEVYNDGDAVKFHHVFSDFKPSGTSGGWDPSSNRYTCPISGHYTFMATLLKADSSEYGNFNAELRHTSGSGDRRLTSLHNSYEGTDARFSSSMHAIVHCAAGDQLWVRAAYYDDMHLYGSDARHNNFLGFLIKPGPL